MPSEDGSYESSQQEYGGYNAELVCLWKEATLGLLKILLNCLERATHGHLDALGGPATCVDLHEVTSAAASILTGHHIRDAIETCDVKAKLESMQS
jgi:hypothetical protein